MKSPFRLPQTRPYSEGDVKKELKLYKLKMKNIITKKWVNHVDRTTKNDWNSFENCAVHSSGCSISLHKTNVSTIYLFQSKATCFDQRLVIFMPLQFCYQMLCPLWDPIVSTVVEYVLAKVSRKVYNYEVLLTGCV